jgi:hypothetical protein
MRRFIPTVCVAVVISAAPVIAQDNNPVALVKGWYTHFLGREADPGGLANWVSLLDNGAPPDFVLSKILGSDEYFNRNGSTPEGFVQGLFRDVLRRKPTRRDNAYWLGRLRSATYEEVASEFLGRNGG